MAKNFGLELLRKCVEKDTKRKEDEIVVIFHWLLLKEGFLSIGAGDAKELSGDEIKSELLPENWNECPNYLLRYLRDNKLFLVKITKSSNDLLINMIRAEDMKVFSSIVPDKEEYDEVYFAELMEKFNKEILQEMLPQKSKSSSNVKKDILIDGQAQDLRPVERRVPPMYPPEFGRSDIDPFAHPTGMIFPTPGRGPGGHGLRYDPINPEQGPFSGLGGSRLGPRGRMPWGPNPDNDHFNPPGGGFFM